MSSIDRAVLGHAARFAAAALVAAAIGRALDMEHVFWVLLTIPFILQPRLGDSVRRSLQRLIGTIFGAAIAWVVVTLIGPERTLWLIALLPPVVVAIYVLVPYRCGLAVVFITMFVLFVYALLGHATGQAAAYRALDTLVAVIAGILVSFLILPARVGHAARGAMPAFLRQTAAAVERSFGTVAGVETGASEGEPAHRRAGQLASEIETARWETLPWLAGGRRWAAAKGIVLAIKVRLAVLAAIADRGALDTTHAAREDIAKLGQEIARLARVTADAYEGDGIVFEHDLEAAVAATEAHVARLRVEVAPQLHASERARLAALLAEGFGTIEDLDRLSQGLDLRARPGPDRSAWFLRRAPGVPG